MGAQKTTVICGRVHVECVRLSSQQRSVRQRLTRITSTHEHDLYPHETSGALECRGIELLYYSDTKCTGNSCMLRLQLRCFLKQGINPHFGSAKTSESAVNIPVGAEGHRNGGPRRVRRQPQVLQLLVEDALVLRPEFGVPTVPSNSSLVQRSQERGPRKAAPTAHGLHAACFCCVGQQQKHKRLVFFRRSNTLRAAHVEYRSISEQVRLVP